MKRTSSRTIVLFALWMLCAFLSPIHTKAQHASLETPTRTGSTELTLFAGLSPAAAHEESAFALEVKTAMPIGGRIAYNFTPHHAAEFSMANSFSLSGDYVYSFSPVLRKWVPYLTGGVGAVRHEIGLAQSGLRPQLNANLTQAGMDGSQTAFATNFGTGAKYLLNKRLAARLDVRDVISHYRAAFTTVPGLPAGVVTKDQTLNDIQITGGIVFRFGSR